MGCMEDKEELIELTESEKERKDFIERLVAECGTVDVGDADLYM